MKYMFLLFSVLFCVSCFYLGEEKIEDDNQFRAMYFSYIEFSKYIEGKTEEESKNNIIEVLDNLKFNGFNNIIVHVRAFADSIYESKLYPVSKYVLNDKGKYPSYDVLEFFINEAHKRNIKFHAWINPYRISNSKEDISYFKGLDVKKTSSGTYFNPASEKVRDYIILGILEIINNYDVDGIHFDDYFYPDKEIDLDTYNEYLKTHNYININDYRYQNVISLLKNTYDSIKRVNKNILFGIAPEGNIDNCYDNSYLDLRSILSSNYLDYIMPQIYFGFENQSRPFINTLKEWEELINNKKIKLIPALAFYKVGNYDKYALSGSNEWINNEDVIKREVEYLKNNSISDGFSLFSYNYIFNKEYQNNNALKEFNNLIDYLKNNS